MDHKTILDILRRAIPELRAIYLFGSQARGDATREGGVDSRGAHVMLGVTCECIITGGLQMAIEGKHIHELIDKLEALPPERIAEVEDFIDFLRQRDQDQQLTRAVARTAEPSLRKVWDNPDDSVYDAL